MKYKAMTRSLALAAAVALALAGCGGSGAGAGGPGTTAQPGGGTEAGSISVGATSVSIGSDSATPVDILAAVKSLGNVGLAGQTVQFSTTDPGAVLSVADPKTDASGVATATLRVTDPTARSIVVNAATGTIQGSVSVKVVGTTLTLSGQNIMAFNTRTPYVVSVRNASNVGIAGVPVQLRSAQGNGVAEASAGSGTTDATGQAKFTVDGRVAGADTLTATALGVTQTTEVSVSGDVAAFDSPAPAAEVIVNQAVDVVVRFLSNGQPLAGSPVQITATRGTLAATSGTTDASGYFRTTLSSPQAGRATISALAGSGTANSVDFEFVSRLASSMDIQASPTTIPTNPSGSSSNSSELIAKVRDTAGNPVKGIRVDFSAVQDPSGGSISPAFAMTNSAGIASTAFIAGPNPSGQNQVVLTSRIPGGAIAAGQPAYLTTVADAISVRMNTGNKVTTSGVGETTYEMPFAVVVSDAAGNPVVGAKVTTSYQPVGFYKGSYVVRGTAWGAPDPDDTWAQAWNSPADKPAEFCLSEDGRVGTIDGAPAFIAGNGVLDPGEDLDGDGVLEPSNVASVYVVTEGGKTDSSGFADLVIKYPRGFANWTVIDLQVTITATSGTEVRTNRQIRLPAVVSDLGIQTSPPGGIDSPFGRVLSCTSRD